MTHAKTLGLDAGQYQAVLELAGSGDFLSVLTAPAGAGKTRTLGAAAAVWQANHYRVVGLAPSARAAAELAEATGGQTDTLAKWLHMRARYASLPVGSPDWARYGLNERIVVLVDEASMANTLDLDRLITAAAAGAAKVVLVGDPAQIGVINGPGGMLAALAHTGHATVLKEIHRFTQPWERTASLALRTGAKEALSDYHDQGRLHACKDGDTALDQVFTHWSDAQAHGHDALMLARTRVDVDALNERARTAAITRGHITGPAITAGDRQWQAGDLLRARRNNRQLALGDSHVRNGDRFLVLGPGPAAPGATNGDAAPGLIVEDLTGRGRIVLPADYLTQHCEYGWASTIDSAQGATADLALVVVRPGMDREHLYVAMTRGRLANHAYVTPDTPDSPANDDHHLPDHTRATVTVAGQSQPPLEQQTRQVLETALATSGAQDAAHTALTTARAAAIATARRDNARAAAQQTAQREAQADAARKPTPQHTADLEQLRQLQQQRAELRHQHQVLIRERQHTDTQLSATPRWARSRRRDLVETLTRHDEQLRQHPTEQTQLDTAISTLTTRLEQHDQQWQARKDTDRRQPRWTDPAPDPLGLGQLAHPTLNRPAPTGPAPRPRLSTPTRYPTQDPYQSPDRDRGIGRSR